MQVPLYSTGNCIQCLVITYNGIYIIWKQDKTLCCTPETNTLFSTEHVWLFSVEVSMRLLGKELPFLYSVFPWCLVQVLTCAKHLYWVLSYFHFVSQLLSVLLKSSWPNDQETTHNSTVLKEEYKRIWNITEKKIWILCDYELF